MIEIGHWFHLVSTWLWVKTCSPFVRIKISWDLWVFTPQTLIIIGFDTRPHYQLGLSDLAQAVQAAADGEAVSEAQFVEKSGRAQ